MNGLLVVNCFERGNFCFQIVVYVLFNALKVNKNLFETVVRRLRKRTLIVTHAGVIRVLLCRLLGLPLESLFSFGQSYGALTIIDVHPEGFRLQGLNLQQPQEAPSILRATVPS